MTLLQIVFLSALAFIILFLLAIILFGAFGSIRHHRTQSQTDAKSPTSSKQKNAFEQTISSKAPIDLLESLKYGEADKATATMAPTSLRTQSKLYHYTALVTAVYDGDTITVDVDLGLNVWAKNQRIRLWKIDTPELKGSERERGIEVRDFVRQLVLNRYVLLRTILDKRGADQLGKYGRLLGEILVEDKNGELVNLNELLLAHGLAVPFGATGSALETAESVPPLPHEAPMSPDAERSSPAPDESTLCPYCGETRRVDIAKQVVLSCPNCLDGSYWYATEEG